MVLGGPLTHYQSLGDIAVGQPLGDEQRHLPLAGTQSPQRLWGSGARGGLGGERQRFLERLLQR